MTHALQNETYIVETPTCFHCKKTGTLEVPAVGFLQWNFGMLVQDAFPELDNDLREQLMSGTHPQCWTEMFGTHE